MENNALDPSKLIMLTNLALVCHARKSKRQAHAAHANFGSLSTGLIGTPHESGKQLDDLGEVLGSLADGKSLLKRKFWTLEIPGGSWRFLEQWAIWFKDSRTSKELKDCSGWSVFMELAHLRWAHVFSKPRWIVKSYWAFALQRWTSSAALFGGICHEHWTLTGCWHWVSLCSPPS